MTRCSANAALLLAAFLWGMGNVSQKLVLEDLGPVTAVGLRCLIGFVLILPLAVRGMAKSMKPAMRHAKGILAVSVLFAVAMILQQTGFGGTSVTNGSFLITTTTVLTPLAAWLLHRVLPSPVVWLAVTATLCGSYLLAGASITAITSGDVLCLASAVFYSFWFVVLGDVVIRSGKPALVTVIQFLLTGVICLTIGLATEPFGVDRLMRAFPDLMVLGVFSTGLAFVIQSIAQQHTSATEAAVMTSAEGIFGSLGGMIFLDERVTSLGAMGAGLIFAAVLTVQLGQALFMQNVWGALVRVRVKSSRRSIL